MKKIFAILLAVLCAAFALAGCNNGGLGESSAEESSAVESSAESPAESSEANPPGASSDESSRTALALEPEEAEQLVQDSLPIDFDGITVSLNETDYTWNGRIYYHFLLDTDQVTLETSVLVDQQNGQVFTYYPDGSAYAPADDPFCKSYGKDASWTGSYVSETGVTLTLEPIDSSSFEFTFAGAEGSLEQQLARADGAQAESTSLDGAVIRFSQSDGVITVTVEGPLPGTLAVEGTYSPAE